MQNVKLQNENGKIPKNWRKVKLGELIEKIEIGGRPKGGALGVLEGIPSIGAEHLSQDGGFDFLSIKYVPKDYFFSARTGKIKENDVLCVKDGATIGKVNRVTKNFPFKQAMINEHVFIVRADNKELDQVFLYYKLRTNEGRSYIINNIGGSAQGGLKKDFLNYWEILIPQGPSEQKWIASILSAFDDKIELNNKINQNLEQMAQAIFKEWFVNSEKLKVKSEKLKGWEVKKIGDIAKVVLGGTPSRLKKEYWGGDIPWINSGKVNEFRIISASENITNEGLKKSNTQLMPKRTTVIAITGATLGQVSLLEINACANQSVVGIFGSDLLSPEFIYLFIKNKINEIIQEAAGGAQQHINKGIVENYPILLPPQNIISKFNKIVKPIFDQISNNIFENQKLTSLRDLLLPKLMSGEIRV